MKEIVEKTGLSKGAFYHYFESKEQLFLEIAETFVFSAQQKVYTDLPDSSFPEFYMAYLSNAVEGFLELKAAGEQFNEEEENGTPLNFFNLIFDAIRLLPSLKLRLQELDAKELNAWSNAIGKARARGEIKSAMNDEQIARIFIYTNDGIGMRGIMEGNIEKVGVQLVGLWNAFYSDLKG